MDPIKTRERAIEATALGLCNDPTVKNVLSYLPVTETVFDCQFRCGLYSKAAGARRDFLAVLQGPYESRPYLPPPQVPARYYTVVTVRDINLRVTTPFSIFFEHRQRRQRNDTRSAEYVSVTAPYEMAPDVLQSHLSAPLQPPLPSGVEEAKEARWLVWGCNRETGHLSWLMLVIEEKVLLATCSHNDSVERVARLGPAEIEQKIMELSPEKRQLSHRKIMALYARNLQLQLTPK